MATRKKVSKVREEIQSFYEERELASLKSNNNRASSISIGPTGGGLIEILMRGDFGYAFYILHPVEAIEIMEQLAAAAGVEILKRPKEDFSSWRSWDTERTNASIWKGAAPFQLSDKDKRQMTKFDQLKYGILPASTSEKPKLEASTKRKKKIEESDEE